MAESNQTAGIQHIPEAIQDLDTACEHALPARDFQLTVGWGDCDPAQIAYTARIPEWALKAIEDWYRYCLVDWYQINLQRGIGTPFVSLSCKFSAPVTPRYPLIMKVFVTRLGNSSLSHRVEALQNNVLCFSADTTAVFVEACGMKPVPIPPNMRKNIENYIQHQQRRF